MYMVRYNEKSLARGKIKNGKIKNGYYCAGYSS